MKNKASIIEKKHIFAEKYRGLYSPEIDNLIDDINKLVQERNKLVQERNNLDNIDKELTLEELKKYYNLTNSIDKLFKEIQQKSNNKLTLL